MFSRPQLTQAPPLQTPSITRVSVLSRRPMEIPTGYGGRTYDASKAEVIVHNDFTQYDAGLLEKLKGARAVIWAQGVPQSDVKKECVLASRESRRGC